MSNKHKISVMISEDKLQEKIAEIGAKIREASAAEIREIMSLIRTYEIPAIFTEVNGSDSTAQAIARETGVAVCPLSMIMSGDGDGLDSYCDTISENVETIANALSEGQVRVQ